jgi:flagellar protein FliL
MSDNELFDSEDEIAGEDAATGGKKIGFIPGLAIQILKWTGIVLAAIIFVVTVVVITLNVMGDSFGSQSRIPADSEAYADRRPELSWYTIEEMRGSTADRSTFIIRPHIGYDPGAQAVLTELISRNIQIREEILVYFNSRNASELEGVEARNRIKNDLVTRLNNNIMRTGRVRDVAFDVFTIIEF